MADTPPNSNLSPESEPWARYVTKSLYNLGQGLDSLSTQVSASFKSVNSSMRVISQQIELIEQTQADLAAQQAELASQQATITAQQAALTAAVNDIAAVSANQISSGTNNASSGGAISVSTGNTYTNATLTVPAGYTKAYVVGTSFITASGTSPLVSLQTNISGDLGFALPVYSGSASDAIVTGGSTHAATFSGLTGGVSTVSVGARMAALSGVTNMYIVNSIFATFLK